VTSQEKVLQARREKDTEDTSCWKERGTNTNMSFTVVMLVIALLDAECCKTAAGSTKSSSWQTMSHTITDAALNGFIPISILIHKSSLFLQLGQNKGGKVGKLRSRKCTLAAQDKISRAGNRSMTLFHIKRMKPFLVDGKFLRAKDEGSGMRTISINTGC